MICLDVYLNGEKLCRAGMQDLTVLNGMLIWVKPKDGDEKITLEVGGLYHRESGESVDPHWIDQLERERGDEITMKFVDSDSADKPVQETNANTTSA